MPAHQITQVLEALCSGWANCPIILKDEPPMLVSMEKEQTNLECAFVVVDRALENASGSELDSGDRGGHSGWGLRARLAARLAGSSVADAEAIGASQQPLSPPQQHDGDVTTEGDGRRAAEGATANPRQPKQRKKRDLAVGGPGEQRRKMRTLRRTRGTAIKAETRQTHGRPPPRS